MGQTFESMDYPSSEPVIHICVLAAGTSTRFGATKLTQHLHGKPLVQHALIAAKGVPGASVNLIVGHNRNAVIEASADLPLRVVDNNDYESGLSSSIVAGVRACRDNASAIVIMLADQPLITSAHLNRLIDQWSGGDEIVASQFDETLGPPILFPAGAFDRLCELTGDQGAKSLLNNGEFEVRRVDLPAAGIDVDTQDALRHLEEN